MDLMIIIYIIFGLLPSLIWLLYYLRKDVHPESNLMILKIFGWGAAITVPVFFIQMGLSKSINYFSAHMGLADLDTLLVTPVSWLTPLALIIVLIYWFFVISFSEEFFKYLVVKLRIINSPHLDEPIDLMLYMVITALGFSAIENILYIVIPTGNYSFEFLVQRTLTISLIRFVGGTFLHTLCSAIIGYAIAISLCDEKNRWLEATSGIIMAIVLHGIYDFSIIALEGNLKIIIPITILIILAIFTSLGFEQLKQLKSVCKLNPYGKIKG